MEELNQKLDKGTFNRFKLIQHLIKKYPIIQYDISRIEEIKNAYIEYIPKYTIPFLKCLALLLYLI